MNNIVFVTSNKGKILRALEQFADSGINIEIYEYDCNEPNINDIEYISKHKALEAFSFVGKPCIVVDSGFYIDDYPGEPGFPGAFPKRLINSIQGENDGITLLLKKMQNQKNRKCQFIDCLTFYDGIDFRVFYGKGEGHLAYEKRGISRVKAKSDLWYIFIPLNSDKTLAEMSDEERNIRNDNRTSAILEFIKWYQNEYLQKPQILKKDIR